MRYGVLKTRKDKGIRTLPQFDIKKEVLCWVVKLVKDRGTGKLPKIDIQKDISKISGTKR